MWHKLNFVTKDSLECLECHNVDLPSETRTRNSNGELITSQSGANKRGGINNREVRSKGKFLLNLVLDWI